MNTVTTDDTDTDLTLFGGRGDRPICNNCHRTEDDEIGSLQETRLLPPWRGGQTHAASTAYLCRECRDLLQNPGDDTPTNNRPSHWDGLRHRCYELDDYTCVCCRRDRGDSTRLPLMAHHVVPLSQGGSNNLSNLRTVCRDCHELIHADTLNPAVASEAAYTLLYDYFSLSTRAVGIINRCINFRSELADPPKNEDQRRSRRKKWLSLVSDYQDIVSEIEEFIERTDAGWVAPRAVYYATRNLQNTRIHLQRRRQWLASVRGEVDYK